MIVNSLRSPDLIAIEEIQDNTGAADDGTVDATQTWNMLTAAIRADGGPAYQLRQFDPENNKDGGAPGGNIRQGFLFRTDRGLGFADRPGGTVQRRRALAALPARLSFHTARGASIQPTRRSSTAASRAAASSRSTVTVSL